MLMTADKVSEGAVSTRAAAQYVRMSTEHQRYSTGNQRIAIERYAEARGFEIVQTYADEGKSGLTLRGRAGLQRLLHEVEQGDAKFEVILVYDVSRWGRFQDPDEAASIELRCKKAGITVHYCAEQFENDGSIGSSIIKTVKRAMAGEYSRELSVKVFAGQSNLVRLGYRQGGVPGYGMKRLLLDPEGNPKSELRHGERKSLQTERVVLIPGAPEEISTIARIFRMFVDEAMKEGMIAATLNREGVKAPSHHPWNSRSVRGVLTNEKYIGNNVWGRTACKLSGKRMSVRPEDWIRADGVFSTVVDPHLFSRAQRLLLQKKAKLTDDELLNLLRGVLSRHGRLAARVIDSDPHSPSSTQFTRRFGTLTHAYERVGHVPDRDVSYIGRNRQLRDLQVQLTREVAEGIKAAGGDVACDANEGFLLINREFSVILTVGRYSLTESGSSRWKISKSAGVAADLVVVARLDASNERPKDFYLLPSGTLRGAGITLCEDNGLALDAFRHSSPALLYDMARRVPF